MWGRMRNSLARFMYGRYGMDELYMALLVLYVILMVVRLFLRGWAAVIIGAIGTLLILWAFYRAFSRNIGKRQQENEWFRCHFAKYRPFFRRLKDRLAGLGKSAYRSCPHCHVSIRLPVKRGKGTVTCPRCRQDFKVFIL